jgi:hypothetical protein
VTQNELKTEAEIRRFLLGEMPENKRGAFEVNFVADEDLFERIRVVEDELIESYVRETLSPIEKEKFERSFLNTKNRRERVAFTRAMLDKLNEQKEIVAAKKTETAIVKPSVWDSITGFFKSPRLAFGAIAALLLAAFGAWFLLKESNKQEIALKTTPTPTVSTTTPVQPDSNQFAATNQNSSGAANSNSRTPAPIETNKNNAEQKKEAPDKSEDTRKEKTTTINPFLALFAGTVRSEGKTKELNLPKNAENVVLQLNLESADYKIYRAEIVTADGETISRTGKLKARNRKINFSIPAAKLQKGDYLVKLSALNPQNENESVADYTFRVNRR